MHSVVEDHIEELSAWARRYGVSRLDVFGSAAMGDFDAGRSDLDFVVAFVAQPPGGMAHAYFGLLNELQALFGRHVDLVTEHSIRNPYFRQSVNESRRPNWSPASSQDGSLPTIPVMRCCDPLWSVNSRSSVKPSIS